MEGASEESCSDSYSPYCGIRSLKARLATVFVKQLHKSFFAELAQGRFMKPRRIGVPSTHHKSSASSTAGSAGDGIESLQPSPSVEEWKLNLITTLMLAFEEKCYVDHIVSEEGLSNFRSLNRSLLGKIMNRMVEFRGQKYSSLTCAIMMINASKLKIPKEVFNKVLASLQASINLNVTSVSEIKRSKAFLLIKRVLQC